MGLWLEYILYRNCVVGIYFVLDRKFSLRLKLKMWLSVALSDLPMFRDNVSPQFSTVKEEDTIFFEFVDYPQECAYS